VSLTWRRSSLQTALPEMLRGVSAQHRDLSPSRVRAVLAQQNLDNRGFWAHQRQSLESFQRMVDRVQGSGAPLHSIKR